MYMYICNSDNDDNDYDNNDNNNDNNNDTSNNHNDNIDTNPNTSRVSPQLMLAQVGMSRSTRSSGRAM